MGFGAVEMAAVPPAGHSPSGQYPTPRRDPLFSQQVAHSGPESKMPSPQGVPSGGAWPRGRAGPGHCLSVGSTVGTGPDATLLPGLCCPPGGAAEGGRRPARGRALPAEHSASVLLEGLFDLGAACGRRGVSTGSRGLLERQEGARTGRHTPSLLRAPQTREPHPGQASGRGRGRAVLEGAPVRDGLAWSRVPVLACGPAASRGWAGAAGGGLRLMGPGASWPAAPRSREGVGARLVGARGHCRGPRVPRRLRLPSGREGSKSSGGGWPARPIPHEQVRGSARTELTRRALLAQLPAFKT